MSDPETSAGEGSGGDLRILHSADWQLGQRSVQLGEKGSQASDKRFAAAERCVALAHEHDVDLVLLAGDTFDSSDLDEALFQRGLAVLESFAPIPVVLLPGNHDPLVPGGIWERGSWQRAGKHLFVAREAEEVEMVGVALYPCPLRQKQSRKDPTEWIPERSPADSRLRVGVAHGALRSLRMVDNFPIDDARAAAADLDYLALGDWHGLKVEARAAYPGTPEATGFGEQSPGHALLVTLDRRRHEPPRFEALPTAQLSWHVVGSEIRDGTDVAALRADLASLGDLGERVLRVELEVTVSDLEVLDELEELRYATEVAAFHLDWRSREEVDRRVELEPGLLRDIDEALAAMEAGGSLPPGEASEDWEPGPAVAAEARLLLHRLVRETT